jgi:hypothetical protein
MHLNMTRPTCLTILLDLLDFLKKNNNKCHDLAVARIWMHITANYWMRFPTTVTVGSALMHATTIVHVTLRISVSKWRTQMGYLRRLRRMFGPIRQTPTTTRMHPSRRGAPMSPPPLARTPPILPMATKRLGLCGLDFEGLYCDNLNEYCACSGSLTDWVVFNLPTFT